VRRHSAALCALPAALAITLAAAPPAPEEFVTIRQGVADRDVLSREPSSSVSLNGRFVAFVSRAPLVGADPRGPAIYVLDRDTGRVTLETAPPDGCGHGRSCGGPRLSGDGRWLVFETAEAGLADGTSPRTVVVLKDRRTGLVKRIGPPGAEANASLRGPAISADGRVLVFASSATNLVPGPDANGTSEDVYSFDVATNQIRRVSLDTADAQSATGASFAPAISGDGRYIAFSSSAPLDRAVGRVTPRPIVSVFVRDSVLRRTTRISVRSDGGVPNGSSYGAAISNDGRFVAFVSDATDVIKGDANRAADVFLYDAHDGTIALVSRNGSGRSASGTSGQPALSADGGVIVFRSDASDLTCAGRCAMDARDINLVDDVFAVERAVGKPWRVSTGRAAWMEPSLGPAVDGTGTIVAFSSRHPCNAQDDGDDYDLFVGGMNKATGAASK
jgi:Tol biopolymer transport system component